VPSLKKFARWWMLAVLAPILLCGLGGVALARAFTIDEIRPPYPNSTLEDAHTVWDITGLHTIRTYKVPSDMTIVMRWYLAEDYLGRYEAYSKVPNYFEYAYSSPVPRKMPIAAPVLTRHTDLRLVQRESYIEVTTDTRFYWRYVRP
jgi:hypothetical protein